MLSGCVSVGDQEMFAVTQGFAPAEPTLASADAPNQSTDGFSTPDPVSAANAIPLPAPSPMAADAASRMPVAATDVAALQTPVMADTSVDALNRGITQSQTAQPVTNLYSAQPNQLAAVAPAAPAVETAPSQPTGAVLSVGDPAQLAPQQVRELAVVAPPKKQSIFARLFATQPGPAKKPSAGTSTRVVSSKPREMAMAAASSGNALPGVRVESMFQVGAEENRVENARDNIQLASAAGLARLAPNGLRLQTDKVEVDCFKPELVRVLKSVERHYGRPVVVTSGYRSSKHNRRIGGASGSRHTSCEAADIQIDGVSKWQLAKYLRSMPGRGGVGTYCHTESVHIDIGSSRDWNWRCRRRK